MHYQKLKQDLCLNANVTNISYAEPMQCLRFTFNNTRAKQPGDLIEITEKGCDLNFFEEFADSCIAGFNALRLSPAEVIAKMKRVYTQCQEFYAKQKAFQEFLVNSRIETFYAHKTARAIRWSDAFAV